MVTLLLRQCAYAVDELECLGEVGKFVLSLEVMLVDHAPVGDNLLQRFEFFPFERGDATAAGNAFLIG